MLEPYSSTNTAAPIVPIRLDILAMVQMQQALLAELAGAACAGCGCTEDSACSIGYDVEGETLYMPCSWDLEATVGIGAPMCTACTSVITIGPEALG